MSGQGDEQMARVRIVDRWPDDERPMLVVDRFGAYDATDVAEFRNGAAAAGLAGALLFEREVEIRRELAPRLVEDSEDGEDGEAVPEWLPGRAPTEMVTGGIGTVEVNREHLAVEVGTVIVSPDAAPLLDDLLVAARDYVREWGGVLARDTSPNQSARILAEAMETLDERFPNLTTRAGSPAIGRFEEVKVSGE